MRARVWIEADEWRGGTLEHAVRVGGGSVATAAEDANAIVWAVDDPDLIVPLLHDGIDLGLGVRRIGHRFAVVLERVRRHPVGLRYIVEQHEGDAVGDRIDVIMDGGVQRGTHVLKALSWGAKAVGVGRFYLYPLGAAGQPGVERALGLMRAEIERGMKLMGCTSIDQFSRENLRFR